jgi:four helix bundle protein
VCEGAKLANLNAETMQDFHHLKVWQKAHELTLAIYRATAEFPREEVYALTSQLRRSSASIPANLAEGCARIGDAEFARYCSIAMGSASELEYHILLARDLGYLGPNEYTELLQRVVQVKRMLTALGQTLRSKPRTSGIRQYDRAARELKADS